MRLVVISDTAPTGTTASGQVLSQFIELIPRSSSVISIVIIHQCENYELEKSNSDFIFSTQAPEELWPEAFSKKLSLASQRWTLNSEADSIAKKVQHAIDEIRPHAIVFSIQTQAVARVANQLNTSRAKRVCFFWDDPAWWINTHETTQKLQKLFLENLGTLSATSNCTFVTSKRAQTFLMSSSECKVSVLSAGSSENFTAQVESALGAQFFKGERGEHSDAGSAQFTAHTPTRISVAVWSKNGPMLTNSAQGRRVPESIFVWRRFSLSKYLYRFLRIHLIVAKALKLSLKPNYVFSRIKTCTSFTFNLIRQAVFAKLEASAERVQHRNRKKLSADSLVPGSLSAKDQVAVALSLGRNRDDFVEHIARSWVNR